VSIIYNNIGGMYEQVGDIDRAWKKCSKALQIKVKLTGEEHADVAKIYLNMGQIKRHTQDLKGAIEYVEKAQKVKHQMLSIFDMDAIRTGNQLAQLYVMDQRP